MKSKKFVLLNHQNKADAYVKALLSAGFEITNNPRKAAFMLADCDAEVYWDRFKEVGRVFTYPHAARPWVAMDCGWKEYPKTICNFVQAEGHIKVLRSYGFKGKLRAVGWTYCEIKPFQPVENPTNVLFLPIHPNSNGWLSDTDKDVNTRTYLKLLDLHLERKIYLTVRHLKALDAQGLWEMPGVKIIQGQPDQSTHEIDKAHVIVGTQTASYIAVARGKPVVGMGESIAPHIGNKPENFVFAKSWDKYRDMMAFPLDILTDCDPLELIYQAAKSDEAIREWRTDMIGEQFDSHKFIEVFKEYM